MIHFKCPSCGKPLAIEDQFAGAETRCPDCNGTLTVPFPQGPFRPLGAPPFPPPPGHQAVWPPHQTYYSPPESLDISVGSVIGESWQIVTSGLGGFIGIVLLYFAFHFIANEALYAIRTTLNWHGQYVKYLLPPILSILTVPLLCGLNLYCLKKTRGEYASVGDLFKGFNFFWRALGAYCLMALLVVLGLIALIVPGLIAALGFSLTFFFIIDTKLGVRDSLKASWNILKGYKWKYARIAVVCALIDLLGALCFGVGLLVTIPVTTVATAVVYHRLRTAQEIAQRQPA